MTRGGIDLTRDSGDLVSIASAARMLGVSAATLRRHESSDGRCQIHGGEIRVFRTSAAGGRRYSRVEIQRLLRRP